MRFPLMTIMNTTHRTSNFILNPRTWKITTLRSKFLLAIDESLGHCDDTQRLPNAFRFRSLEEIKYELLQQLQNLQGAPSVQMQQVPPLYEVRREVEDNPDERPSAKTRNGDGENKVHESELYDQID